MSLSFHHNPVISEDIAILQKSGLPWEKLKGKTILISGANGFLPAYMVYTLLGLNDSHQLGLKVIAMVRNKTKGTDRFSSFLERKDFRLWVNDVCQPMELEEDLHFIIHAASQASPKFYGSDPVGTLSANVTGTLNLLRLASEKKVERFLYFSSSEVYGAPEAGKIPTRETDYGYIDPTNVRSCYAESKRMGETICVSWMQQFGIPVVMVRPFHTYGPGMDLSDGRVYADFVANMVAKKDIQMNSDGSAVRAFCYITDAVYGFFLVLLKGEAGSAYNVGSDRNICSILQLAEILVGLFPESNLKVVRMPSENKTGYLNTLVSKTAPDVSRLRSLGWGFNETSIEKGFLRTINSYQ
jgi:nucleoside-diphosphate-sugar epimerase